MAKVKKEVVKEIPEGRTLEKWKSKLSHKFIMILAIVSILGFAGIVSETIFNRNINLHVQALWMIAIGIGMITEAQIKSLKSLKVEGLTPNNFAHLTTAIIGLVTILAGVFSFPHFGVVNPSFHAIRGIVSIIAIIVIIIQTWFIE
ncbi:MAG: hypothetical protein KKH88_03130 [Nanoarchaeota archaeon]|nr:hypothetical protein [Nanoarchaeota archaeon]